MIYKVFDIEYDTDGEVIDLPKEIEIELPDDCEDVEEAISDKISEITGFCHFGFNYEVTFNDTEIKPFLNSFCTKVRKKESSAYVELMMDDHKCIEYNKKQYYIPENNSSFSPTDDLICEYLTNNYLLK